MRNRVSVVVPAFNEASTIAQTLRSIERSLDPSDHWAEAEIVVVDDGSTDGTAAALSGYRTESSAGLVVVTHPENRGLAAAIASGVQAARHPRVVVLDADLSYSPALVGPLVEALAESGAAVAIASPYMPGGRTENVPADRLAYSRLANGLLSWCVGGRIKTFTGMVRAYDRSELLDVLRAQPRGEFNAWVVAQFLERGAGIVEIPAALVWPHHRSASPSRMSAATFRRRVSQVAATLSVMIAAERRCAARVQSGTVPPGAGPLA